MYIIHKVKQLKGYLPCQISHKRLLGHNRKKKSGGGGVTVNFGYGNKNLGILK